MGAVYPGDELIPDAAMVLDRAKDIATTCEVVWPWLVQLGKHRAGWYLLYALGFGPGGLFARGSPA